MKDTLIIKQLPNNKNSDYKKQQYNIGNIIIITHNEISEYCPIPIILYITASAISTIHFQNEK